MHAKGLYMAFMFTNIMAVISVARTQAGESMENESGKTDHIVQDSLLVQLLTALHDEPKTLSLEEVNALRRSTPVAVERYVRLMNNPGLLEDLSLNRISKSTFEDLQKSLNFLEIGQCRTSEREQSQTCLIIRKPIDFPQHNPIVLSRLSMLLVPWIDPTKIVLTAYAIDLREKQSEQDVFQLDNSSHLFGTFAASRVHKQEVRWDVTEMIIDLQRRKNSSWFPLILIMNCLDQNCRFSHDSWRLHTYPAFSNLILLPETQAVLELYTQSTIGLVKLYGDRRVQKRSTPSPDNDCPSFLDPNVRHTRCCLFRFTLNKQQMDQNDMLRFIIFPHHLPVNLCHGRCIGVYIPRDNTHSLLLNRYFAGLNDKEREILYNSMPCCAANETSPFTIVYKTRDNLLVTDTLQKAVKMSCACG